MPSRVAEFLSETQSAFTALLNRHGDRKTALELFAVRGRSRGWEWSEGRLEEAEESEEQGLGLRVLKEGRLGFAYASGLSPQSALDLLPKALAATKIAPSEPWRVLPKVGNRNLLSEEHSDPKVFGASFEAKKEELKSLENLCLSSDRRLKKVLRAGFEESRALTAVVSSEGIASASEETRCSLGFSCLAESDGETQVSDDFQSARFGEDLDARALALRAARRALRLLGSRKIPSGRMPVVFDPQAGVSFLELLVSSLCADQVQRGKSLMAGKKGRTVASPLVTLVDDGLRPRASGSAAFDDEGTPTQRTVLVEKGVLKGTLYDADSAAKDGVHSTGNGFRSSFRGLPSPEASNFYWEPGSETPDALLRGCSRGFYCTEILGMHTADEISGDFSVGVSGLLIERGAFSHAVRGATMAGNVLTMLENIDGLANDLTFYGAIGCPTFRVPELSLGGAS